MKVDWAPPVGVTPQVLVQLTVRPPASASPLLAALQGAAIALCPCLSRHFPSPPSFYCAPRHPARWGARGVAGGRDWCCSPGYWGRAHGTPTAGGSFASTHPHDHDGIDCVAAVAGTVASVAAGVVASVVAGTVTSGVTHPGGGGGGEGFLYLALPRPRAFPPPLAAQRGSHSAVGVVTSTADKARRHLSPRGHAAHHPQPPDARGGRGRRPGGVRPVARGGGWVWWAVARFAAATRSSPPRAGGRELVSASGAAWKRASRGAPCSPLLVWLSMCVPQRRVVLGGRVFCRPHGPSGRGACRVRKIRGDSLSVRRRRSRGR